MLFVCYNKKEIFYAWGKVLKKENQKKKNEKLAKSFNWLRFLITLSAIFCISVLASCLRNYADITLNTRSIDNLDTIMSSVCQIQAAVATVVLTVLSIMTTLSKTKVLNIEVIELMSVDSRKIRFTLLEAVIIQILLIAYSVITLIISSYTLLCAAFLSSLIMTIWTCATNLPMALNSEVTAIKILATALKKNDKMQYATFKIVLRYMITTIGFDKTLNLLLRSSNENNLIALMLNTVKEMAYEIDEKTDEDTIFLMQRTASLILSDDEFLSNVKNTDNDKVFIDSIVTVVNQTISRFKPQNTFEDYIDSIVWYLMEKLQKNIDKYIDIYAIIIDRLIIDSLNENNFDIIKLIRNHVFQDDGIRCLVRQNETNIYYNKVFFDISLYLYFLSLGEITDEIKNEITDFVNQESNMNKNQNWSILFSWFISSFNLKLNDIKEDDEKHRANFYAQNCFIHAYSRYDFWMKCWLLKRLEKGNIIESTDLQELYRDIDQWDDSLKQDFAIAISQYTNDPEAKKSYESRRYDIEQSLAQLYKIFGLKKHNLTTEQLSELEQSIFDLKNELKKKLFITDHDQKQIGYDENKMNEFASIILKRLNEAIPRWEFFDNYLAVDDSGMKEISIEINEDMVKGFSEDNIKRNVDGISMWIQDYICKELRNNIDTIENMENLKNLPSKLNEIDVDYFKISVLGYIKDQSILDKIKVPVGNIENKAKRMVVRTIPSIFYMNKDGFSYNCKIESIVLVAFDVDNLPDKIYTIEQIFFNLEEYKEIANKYYYRLLINLKIAIHFDRDKCLMVDEKIFKN